MASLNLYSISYVSHAEIEFDESALIALGHHAAEKNERLGITGYLFYLAPYFVQYLEGTEEAIKDVYSKIQTDPRHRVVRFVTLPGTTDRIFPDWSMRSSGADHRFSPGWSTRDQAPADASAVRLEHVLLSVLLHTPVNKFESHSVTEMIAKLFTDLAARERCALAQT